MCRVHIKQNYQLAPPAPIISPHHPPTLTHHYHHHNAIRSRLLESSLVLEFYSLLQYIDGSNVFAPHARAARRPHGKGAAFTSTLRCKASLNLNAAATGAKAVCLYSVQQPNACLPRNLPQNQSSPPFLQPSDHLLVSCS